MWPLDFSAFAHSFKSWACWACIHKMNGSMKKRRAATAEEYKNIVAFVHLVRCYVLGDKEKMVREKSERS